MSTDFISQEIEKIVKNESFEYPLNIAMASAWILGNFKGENLKVLDISKISSLADYFVIASATNITQAKAMADTLKSQIIKNGGTCNSQEGTETGNWILSDFGDIIVHIFLDTARDLYDLDELWQEGEIVDIPSEYYSSSQEDLNAFKTDNEREYF